VASLPKSRYESISLYLANCAGCQTKYCDLDAPVDEVSVGMLTEAGIDITLARHIAHLFVRDPLVIHQERLHLDDAVDTDHFENLQSTNWQTVRWKPPPKRTSSCGPHIGWRVEFRSMEVQLTDFENAAFTVFIALVSRVILAFDLNLYIPLSKVDENMRRAHARSALRSQTFWFRKHMGPPAAGSVGDPDEYEEMTVEEILTGKGDYFPGLITLVRAYLEAIGCDPETGEKVGEYMELIRLRATGELKTAAEWMRARLMAHPEYKADSEVSAGMTYDLLRACSEVSEGRQSAPDLLGQHWVRPLKVEHAWYTPLTSVGKQDYSALLARYVRQADPAEFRQAEPVFAGDPVERP